MLKWLQRHSQGSRSKRRGSAGRSVAFARNAYVPQCESLESRWLLTGGILDSSFQGNGRVTTDLGGIEEARGLVFQNDGKLVVAGGTTLHGALAVARYDIDGSLDVTFGSGGVTTTELEPGRDVAATTAALQADGKIVVAGGTCVGVPTCSWLFARYTASGQLDTTFGDQGTLLVDLGQTYETAFDMVIQPDGKIVATGYAGGSHGDYDFFLVRLNPNGNLDDGSPFDTTPGDAFGTGGVVMTNLQVSDVAWGLALQPDGKLLVAGRTGGLFQSDAIALVRYNSDGSLDNTFGTNGIATPDFPGQDGANAVAVLNDGRIIVGGNTTMHGFNEFAVTRFLANGTLDTSFGSQGIATAGVTTPIYGIESLVIQPNGKIVATGTTFGPGGNEDFGLVRFMPSGLPDASFGTQGAVVTDIAGGGDAAHEVRLQADGRIVVAGYAYGVSGTVDFALARYLPGETTHVLIDVKPDERCLAEINLASEGKLPVAILGAADFQVLAINVASLRFGGAPAVKVSYDDLNDDGILDAIFKFRVQDLALTDLYGDLLAVADTVDDGRLDKRVDSHQVASVALTGKTLAGDDFEGSSQVEIFLEGKSLRSFLKGLEGI